MFSPASPPYNQNGSEGFGIEPEGHEAHLPLTTLGEQIQPEIEDNQGDAKHSGESEDETDESDSEEEAHLEERKVFLPSSLFPYSLFDLISSTIFSLT